MRLKLNERSQAELLEIMGIMGLSSPAYALQKIISEQYKIMNNPQREVKNDNNEYQHH